MTRGHSPPADGQDGDPGQKAHSALQASVTNWGKLLIPTGRTFKPVKCFSYLVSYDWLSDGRWRYAKNEEPEDLDILVLIPGGDEVFIKHAAVDDVRETLGVYTCPDGSCEDQLEVMDEKEEKWVATAQEGAR